MQPSRLHEQGAEDLPRDTRLLNPAWYVLPIALYCALTYVELRVLLGIPGVQDLNAWLLRQDRVQVDALSLAAIARTLSLMLMPLQLVGFFWVFWPMRVLDVKMHQDGNSRPHAAIEPWFLLYFFGGGYVHYFLAPSTSCAFCPQGPTGIAVMEAVMLLTLPLALFLAAQALHTRLVLAFPEMTRR